MRADVHQGKLGFTGRRMGNFLVKFRPPCPSDKFTAFLVLLFSVNCSNEFLLLGRKTDFLSLTSEAFVPQRRRGGDNEQRK